jgi:membrane protein implicated in regulation of membrane protease activity
MWWSEWWAWGIAGMLLAFVEVLLPGYLFLGFAAGAGVIALLLLAGGPGVAWLTGSFGALLVLFGVLSLAAWLGLRMGLGVRKGQMKIFDRDINED